MLIDWIAFPLVLGLTLLGCGLLAREAFGVRIPGALVPGLGLALLIVVAQVTAYADATAGLTTPLVVSIAVIGIGLAVARGFERPSGWALAAVVGVLCAYAAPIVLSGQATFAGFIKLDDTATWMALTDRIMQGGRSLAGLQPSTYEATLAFNLGQGYPIGAFLPLGVGRQLVGQDVAWVVQPYMACMAGLLALALWELPRGLIASPRLRAGVAFVAAQPALLYGYYLWGGIKEMTAAALIATTAGISGQAIRDPRRVGPVLALAISGGAMVGVLSGGGAIWIVPPLVAVLVATVIALERRLALRRVVGYVVAVAVLSVPVILPGGFLPPTSSPIDSPIALGNLIDPLRLQQLAGIWPSGDFRVAPGDLAPADVLMVFAGTAAFGMLVVAWRRGSWTALVYTIGALAACLVIFAIGSPWVGGKALASASPAIPFAAAAGAALLWASGRRVQGGVVALAIAGGVLWSNALAFRDVNLAPRQQLGDLQEIGEQVAGMGPTLMTEYEPYGARHFLRDAAPEGASELRRRVVPLLSGNGLPKGESADTDQFQLDGLLAYRTLVVRRSPAQSRPPSPYRLVYPGTSYEAWQRPAGPSTGLIDHFGLGGAVDPAAVPRCRDLARLAAEAGPAGRVAVVSRAPVLAFSLADLRHPAAWDVPAYASALLPRTPGSIIAKVSVPAQGSYEVWLGGSIRPQVDLLVDGKAEESVRQTLNNDGQYVSFGRVQLSRGAHRLELAFHGADLHPGSGGAPDPIGPLVLSSDDAAATHVRSVPAGRATTLCGRRWDWVEALAPSE